MSKIVENVGDVSNVGLLGPKLLLVLFGAKLGESDQKSTTYSRENMQILAPPKKHAKRTNRQNFTHVPTGQQKLATQILHAHVHSFDAGLERGFGVMWLFPPASGGLQLLQLGVVLPTFLWSGSSCALPCMI